MTYQEHDRAKELVEKIVKGEITSEEIKEALLLLLKDYWERGLE